MEGLSHSRIDEDPVHHVIRQSSIYCWERRPRPPPMPAGPPRRRWRAAACGLDGVKDRWKTGHEGQAPVPHGRPQHIYQDGSPPSVDAPPSVAAACPSLSRSLQSFPAQSEALARWRTDPIRAI